MLTHSCFLMTPIMSVTLNLMVNKYTENPEGTGISSHECTAFSTVERMSAAVDEHNKASEIYKHRGYITSEPNNIESTDTGYKIQSSFQSGRDVDNSQSILNTGNNYKAHNLVDTGQRLLKTGYDCKTHHVIDNSQSMLKTGIDYKTWDFIHNEKDNGQSRLNRSKVGTQKSRHCEMLDARSLKTNDHDSSLSVDVGNANDNQYMTYKRENTFISSERKEPDKRNIVKIPQACANDEFDFCSKENNGRFANGTSNINGTKTHVHVTSKEACDMISEIQCLQDMIRSTTYTGDCRLSSCDATTSAVFDRNINPVKERCRTVMPCLLTAEEPFTKIANKLHTNKHIPKSGCITFYDNTALAKTKHKTEAYNSIIDCCRGSGLVKRNLVCISRSVCTLTVSDCPHKSPRQKRACQSRSLENVVQEDRKRSQTCLINNIKQDVANKITYANTRRSNSGHIPIIRHTISSDLVTTKYIEKYKLLSQKCLKQNSQNVSQSPPVSRKKAMVDSAETSNKTLKNLTRNPMTQWTRLVNDNIEAVFRTDAQHGCKDFKASNMSKTEHCQGNRNLNPEKIKPGKVDLVSVQFKSEESFKHTQCSESSMIKDSENMLKTPSLCDSLKPLELKDTEYDTDPNFLSVKFHNIEAEHLKEGMPVISEPLETDDWHWYSTNLANIGGSFNQDYVKPHCFESERGAVYDKNNDEITLVENVCQNNETTALQDTCLDISSISSSSKFKNNQPVILTHNSVHKIESMEASKDVVNEHNNIHFLKAYKEDFENAGVCDRHEHTNEDKCVHIEECIQCGFRHLDKLDINCRDKDKHSLILNDCDHYNRTEMVIDEARVQEVHVNETIGIRECLSTVGHTLLSEDGSTSKFGKAYCDKHLKKNVKYISSSNEKVKINNSDTQFPGLNVKNSELYSCDDNTEIDTTDDKLEAKEKKSLGNPAQYKFNLHKENDLLEDTLRKITCKADCKIPLYDVAVSGNLDENKIDDENNTLLPCVLKELFDDVSDPDHQVKHAYQLGSVNSLHKDAKLDSVNSLHKDAKLCSVNLLHKDVKLGSVNSIHKEAMLGSVNSLHKDAKLGSVNSLHKDAKLGSVNSLHKEAKLGSVNSLHKDAKLGSVNSLHKDAKLGGVNSLHKEAKLGGVNSLHKDAKLGGVNSLHKDAKLGGVNSLHKEAKLGSVNSLHKDAKLGSVNSLHKEAKLGSVNSLHKEAKMPDKDKQCSLTQLGSGVSLSTGNVANDSEKMYGIIFSQFPHSASKQFPHSMTEQFQHPGCRTAELYACPSTDNLVMENACGPLTKGITSVKQDATSQASYIDINLSQNAGSMITRTDCSISDYRRECRQCDDQMILNCVEYDAAKPDESHPSNRKELKTTHCLAHVENLNRAIKPLTRNPMTQWTRLVNANTEALLENKRVEVDKTKFEGEDCEACAFGKSGSLKARQSLNIEKNKAANSDFRNVLRQDDFSLGKDGNCLLKVHQKKNHKVPNYQSTSKTPGIFASLNSLEQKNICCNETGESLVNKLGDGEIDPGNNLTMNIQVENKLESGEIAEAVDWHWYSVQSESTGYSYSQDCIWSYCLENEIKAVYGRTENEKKTLEEKCMDVCKNYETRTIQDTDVDRLCNSLTAQINSTEPGVVCTLNSVNVPESVKVDKWDIQDGNNPQFVRNHAAYSENEIISTIYDYENGSNNIRECVVSRFRRNDTTGRQSTYKDTKSFVISDTGSYDRKEASTVEVGAQDMITSAIMNDSEHSTTTIAGLGDCMKVTDCCKVTSYNTCITKFTFDSSEPAETKKFDSNALPGVTVSKFVNCCDDETDIDFTTDTLDIHGAREHPHIPGQKQFTSQCANDHQQDTTINTSCKTDTQIFSFGMTTSETIDDRSSNKLATNSLILSASGNIKTSDNIYNAEEYIVSCTQHSGGVESLHDDATLGERTYETTNSLIPNISRIKETSVKISNAEENVNCTERSGNIASLSDDATTGERKDEAEAYEPVIDLRCGNSSSKNSAYVNRSACVLSVPICQKSMCRKNGLCQSTSPENLAKRDACRSHTFCVWSVRPRTIDSKSDTEIRSPDKDRYDAEIRGADKDMCDTEIRGAENDRFATEIIVADNDKYGTEIIGAENDRYDTEIRGADKEMCDTEIRGADKEMCDTEIRGTENDRYAIEIRGADNDRYATEIRGADNDRYDTETIDAENDRYDTEIRGADKDRYDAEIRGADNDRYDTEIIVADNDRYDTEIIVADNDRYDTEIRGAENDNYDTEIKDADNDRYDTEIIDADKGMCDTDIRGTESIDYSHGKNIVFVANCAGNIWKDRYDEIETHDLLLYIEKAASEMREKHNPVIKETEAAPTENCNRTFKHLTRNPVTQWTRLVNANIEAVVRNKTDATDKKCYGNRDFKSFGFCKSRPMHTTKHVNTENTQELNAACHKRVPSVGNETCRDITIEAKCKHMDMTFFEKVKPEIAEFAEKDKQHLYSINLGSVECSPNQDCIELHHHEWEMYYTDAHQEHSTSDANWDHVVNKDVIISRPPVLSLSQSNNIFNYTQLFTKADCETEYVGTDNDTKKEENNIIFMKDSRKTKTCDEQRKQSDFLDNDKSRNELNTDRVYTHDFTNRRIRGANKIKSDTEIRGANNGNSDTEIRDANNEMCDNEIRGANNGMCDIEITGTNNEMHDAEIRSASNGRCDTEIRGADNEMCDTDIRSANNGMCDTEIRSANNGNSHNDISGTDNWKSDTEIRDADNGVCNTEIRSTSNEMCDTEIRSTSNGMCDTEIRSTSNEMCYTEIRSTSNGMCYTEIRSTSNGMCDTEIRSTSNGMCDIEIRGTSNGMCDTEIRSTSNGMCDTEIRSTSNGMCDTEIRGTSNEMCDTEIRSTSNEMCDTEIRSTSNGMCDTENRSTSNGMCDTEIRGTSNGMCDTEIRSTSNEMCDTEIRSTSNEMCDTEIRSTSNGMCDTKIRSTSNEMCDTEIRSTSNEMCDTEIRSTSNGMCDTDIRSADKAMCDLEIGDYSHGKYMVSVSNCAGNIWKDRYNEKENHDLLRNIEKAAAEMRELHNTIRGADNEKPDTEIIDGGSGLCDAEIRGADNGMCDTEISSAANGMCDTEISGADNGMCDTEISGAANGMCDTEISGADNRMCDTEIRGSDNGMCDTEIRGSDNGMCDTEIRGGNNGKSDSEIRSANNGMSDTEIGDYSDGKYMMSVANCAGNIWKDRYNEKENHNLLLYIEKAAAEMRELHNTVRKEFKAAQTENCNSGFKHLTRNPVTQWTRLVNANIEAVVTNKTDRIDQKCYGNRDFKSFGFCKSRPLHTTKLVNTENMMSDSCNASTVPFRHNNYFFEEEQMKECCELRNDKNILNISEIIGSSNSQELNAASHKRIPNVGNEKCSDNNIEANCKHMDMIFFEKVKPEIAEFAEKDKQRLYSINLGSVECSSNQDCKELHHHVCEMYYTDAHQEHATSDANCDHVVNKDVIISRPPVLSLSQSNNSFNYTQLCTKADCETEYVGTDNDTKKEEDNIIFMKDSRKTKTCDEQRKQSDFLDNDKSRNELNTDEVYTHDFTNRRIRGANKMKSDTEIRGANNGNSDTKIRDANNEMCDNEIRGTNNDMCDTEIRGSNNRMCDTEIRVSDNRMCDTEIRGSNNGMCDIEIRGSNNGMCDTEIRGSNNGMCDTEIRGSDNGMCDFEIRGSDNGMCDAEIRGSDNGMCNTEVRGSNNGMCDTEIRGSDNGMCDTEIRGSDNGMCDTEIRGSDNGMCDTKIRGSDNGMCDTEISGADNKMYDTEIRGCCNGMCDTEIRGCCNGMCDTEINGAENVMCDNEIRDYSDRKHMMSVANYAGNIWKENDEKENHNLLQYFEQAEAEMREKYPVRKEPEAAPTENCNRTIKHLTRNPVTQWARLVNANIEAVVTNKTDRIDQKCYGNRYLKSIGFCKSRPLHTTKLVNTENMMSDRSNASTVPFRHNDYCFEAEQMKKCCELRNHKNIFRISEIISSSVSQELNAACHKGIPSVGNEICSDNNIDAKCKNMDVTDFEKVKPDIAESDEWRWYSVNLGSIGCLSNQDCKESHHRNNEMNPTDAHQEVHATSDENYDHVVNEDMILNIPPELSVSQSKNISDDTQLCTKPSHETECFGTNKYTKKEENNINFIEKSKETKLCDELRKQSDFLYNDNSRNELNTDEIYFKDVSNRIPNISESLQICRQAIPGGHMDNTDSFGNVYDDDKHMKKILKCVSASNKIIHTKQPDTAHILQTDVCELHSCFKDFNLDCNSLGLNQAMNSENESSMQCERNFHNDPVRNAIFSPETQVFSRDITTSEVSNKENQKRKVRTKTVMPCIIDTIPRPNSYSREKQKINNNKLSDVVDRLLDDIDTMNKSVHNKKKFNSDAYIDCGSALPKRNSFRISRSEHALILGIFPHSLLKENRLYQSTSAGNVVIKDRHKTQLCQHKIRKANRLSRVSNSNNRGAVTSSSIGYLKAGMSGDGCRADIKDDEPTSLQCLQQAMANVSQLHPSSSADFEGKYCMAHTEQSNVSQLYPSSSADFEGKYCVDHTEQSNVSQLYPSSSADFEGKYCVDHTEQSNVSQLYPSSSADFEGKYCVAHTEQSNVSQLYPSSSADFEGKYCVDHTEQSNVSQLYPSSSADFEGKYCVAHTEQSNVSQLHPSNSADFEGKYCVAHTEQSNVSQLYPSSSADFEGKYCMAHTEQSNVSQLHPSNSADFEGKYCMAHTEKSNVSQLHPSNSADFEGKYCMAHTEKSNVSQLHPSSSADFEGKYCVAHTEQSNVSQLHPSNSADFEGKYCMAHTEKSNVSQLHPSNSADFEGKYCMDHTEQSNETLKYLTRNPVRRTLKQLTRNPMTQWTRLVNNNIEAVFNTNIGDIDLAKYGGGDFEPGIFGKSKSSIIFSEKVVEKSSSESESARSAIEKLYLRSDDIFDVKEVDAVPGASNVCADSRKAPQGEPATSDICVCGETKSVDYVCSVTGASLTDAWSDYSKFNDRSNIIVKLQSQNEGYLHVDDSCTNVGSTHVECSPCEKDCQKRSEKQGTNQDQFPYSAIAGSAISAHDDTISSVASENPNYLNVNTLSDASVGEFDNKPLNNFCWLENVKENLVYDSVKLPNISEDISNLQGFQCAAANEICIDFSGNKVQKKRSNEIGQLELPGVCSHNKDLMFQESITCNEIKTETNSDDFHQNNGSEEMSLLKRHISDIKIRNPFLRDEWKCAQEHYSVDCKLQNVEQLNVGHDGHSLNSKTLSLQNITTSGNLSGAEIRARTLNNTQGMFNSVPTSEVKPSISSSMFKSVPTCEVKPSTSLSMVNSVPTSEVKPSISSSMFNSVPTSEVKPSISSSMFNSVPTIEVKPSTCSSMFNSVSISEIKAASPSSGCVQYLKSESSQQETDTFLGSITSERTDAELQCKSISQQHKLSKPCFNQWNNVSLASSFGHSKKPLKNLDVTIYIHKTKGCDKDSRIKKSSDCEDKICSMDNKKNQEIISSTDKGKDEGKISRKGKRKYKNISRTDKRKVQDEISSTHKRKDKISVSCSSNDKDVIHSKDKRNEHNNALKIGIATQISENYERMSSKLSTNCAQRNATAQSNATKQGTAIGVLGELSCEDKSSNTGWSHFWHLMTNMFTHSSKPPSHDNDLENQALMVIENKQNNLESQSSNNKHKVHCFKSEQGQKYSEAANLTSNINSFHNNEKNKELALDSACVKNDSPNKKYRKRKVITGIKVATGEENPVVTEYKKIAVQSKVKLSKRKKSSTGTDWQEPTENILFRDQVVGTCVETGFLSSENNIEKCSYFLIPQDHSNNDTQIKQNQDRLDSETVLFGNQTTFTESKECYDLCECNQGHNQTKIPVFMSRHSESVIEDFSNEKMTERYHQNEANSPKNKRKYKNESKVRSHMIETESFDKITENKESQQEDSCAWQTSQDNISNICPVESADKTAICEDFSRCGVKSEPNEPLNEIGSAETDIRKYSSMPLAKSTWMKEKPDNIIHFQDTPARIREKFSVDTKSISNDENMRDYFQNLVTVEQRATDTVPDLHQQAEDCCREACFDQRAEDCCREACFDQQAKDCCREECFDQTESELLQSSLECLLEMLLQRGKVTHAFIANTDGEILAKTAKCKVTLNDIKSILFCLTSRYRGMVKIEVSNDVYTCFKHEEHSLIGRASTNIFVAHHGQQSIVVGFSDALTPGSCVKEVEEISELLSHRGL